ncbi:hypothetical protein M0R04_12090 [Candidatus Dojkabacteria bacterium]|jgi:hypothetical protein|nr:hypothetical protein [Candidatus Dojkabacteria bacterium]
MLTIYQEIELLKEAIIELSSQLDRAWYEIDEIRGHNETWEKTEHIEERISEILGVDDNN